MFYHFTLHNPLDNQKLLYELLDMTAHFVSHLKNSKVAGNLNNGVRKN